MPKKETETEPGSMKKPQRKVSAPKDKKAAPAPAEAKPQRKKVAPKRAARRKAAAVSSAEPEKEPSEGEPSYFVRWTDQDYLRTEGEVLFYKVALVASVLAMLWSLHDGSYVSFLTFIMLLVVIVFELQSEPRLVEYEINIDGIKIDGKLNRFEDIRSFDLVEKGDRHVVRLTLSDAILPVKEIPLAMGQDLEYMRALLAYFLPQEKQEDTLLNFKRPKRQSEEEFIEEQVQRYLKDKR